MSLLWFGILASKLSDCVYWRAVLRLVFCVSRTNLAMENDPKGDYLCFYTYTIHKYNKVNSAVI